MLKSEFERHRLRELRWDCLKLAHDPKADIDDVIDRADAYFDYLENGISEREAEFSNAA